MSTPSVLYNGTIDQEVEVFQTVGDAVMGVAAFVAYSHFILLGREIEYVWSQPLRPSSWIYALIRYPGLLNVLINASLNSYTPDCNQVAKLASVSWMISNLTTTIFQILRTHAVCGRKWIITVPLVIVALPINALNLFLTTEAACGAATVLTGSLATVQFVFDMTFESLILIVNIGATWAQVSSARKLQITGPSLSQSVLQNGVVYYAVFVVTEIISVTTLQLLSEESALLINDILGEFSDPIRWALSSQFLLELRERVEKGPDPSAGVLSTTMSSFRATVHRAVRTTIDEDFGESLVHFVDLQGSDLTSEPEVIELEECGEEGERELREGMVLRERYLAQDAQSE